MPNNNANKRVAVAMSGGVDSAVAAAMMVEQGYEVIGLTMQLYDTGASKNSSSKTCCAGQDIYYAKRVSDKFFRRCHERFCKYICRRKNTYTLYKV